MPIFLALSLTSGSSINDSCSNFLGISDNISAQLFPLLDRYSILFVKINDILSTFYRLPQGLFFFLSRILFLASCEFATLYLHKYSPYLIDTPSTVVITQLHGPHLNLSFRSQTNVLTFCDQFFITNSVPS